MIPAGGIGPVEALQLEVCGLRDALAAGCVPRVRAVIDVMQQEENALLRRRDAEARSAVRTAVVVGPVAAILVVGVLAFVITRSVTRPVREVTTDLSATTSHLVANAAQQAAGATEQAAAVAETVTTVDEVTQTSDQAAQRARAIGEAIRRTSDIDRAARDVARTTGKDVEVVAEGGAVELDRSILDGLRGGRTALRARGGGEGPRPPRPPPPARHRRHPATVG